MEALKNNKVFWVLIIVSVFNVGALILGKVIVDRAANRVIQKLQKEYSPSPYGPGFDPDKISPNFFDPSKKYIEMRQSSKIFPQDPVEDRVEQMAVEADAWR